MTCGHRQNPLDVDFRQQPQPVPRQLQPLGAQADLLGRFFAGDVQGAVADGQFGQHLQQQGRFADARIATDQGHGTIDQPAAQDPIQLAIATGLAHFRFGVDFGQCADFGAACRPGVTGRFTGTLGDRGRYGFQQGIPRPAVAALTGPLGGLRAAFGADINGAAFAHRILRERSRPSGRRGIAG